MTQTRAISCYPRRLTRQELKTKTRQNPKHNRYIIIIRKKKQLHHILGSNADFCGQSWLLPQGHCPFPHFQSKWVFSKPTVKLLPLLIYS